MMGASQVPVSCNCFYKDYGLYFIRVNIQKHVDNAGENGVNLNREMTMLMGLAGKVLNVCH